MEIFLLPKTIYKTIFLIHTLLPFVFSRISEKELLVLVRIDVRLNTKRIQAKKICVKCVFVFKFMSILTNTNNSF
jgi:hypothetical protein